MKREKIHGTVVPVKRNQMGSRSPSKAGGHVAGPHKAAVLDHEEVPGVLGNRGSFPEMNQDAMPPCSPEQTNLSSSTEVWMGLPKSGGYRRSGGADTWGPCGTQWKGPVRGECDCSEHGEEVPLASSEGRSRHRWADAKKSLSLVKPQMESQNSTCNPTFWNIS